VAVAGAAAACDALHRSRFASKTCLKNKPEQKLNKPN
jgi:hypothetical protein